MPNPTTNVSASLTLSLTDIIGNGIPTLTRVIPPVIAGAVNVQYQGNVFLNPAAAPVFAPVTPILFFSVAYVRNLGGQGCGNLLVEYQLQPGGTGNVVNLDIGAMLLYISPKLSAVTVGTTVPGLLSVTISTMATTSGNLEVLFAG